MSRIFLFDVDGVLLSGRPLDGASWKTGLKADLAIDPVALHAQFFQPHWPDIVTGKQPIRPLLTASLTAMGSAVTADDLLAYWFENDGRINKDVLTVVRGLRSSGYRVCLATNQEHERSAWVAKTFAGVFNHIYASADLGVAKPDPNFFEAICTAEETEPSNLVFVDDNFENVAAAEALGMRAHTYETPSKLVRWLIRLDRD